MGVYIWQDYNRTPGANTICYYPLSSNFQDASGNCSDIVPSNSSSVIGTYQGVSCFNMNNKYSTVATINNMNNISEYTWSIRIYQTGRCTIMFRQSVDNRGGQGFHSENSGIDTFRMGNPTNKSYTFTALSTNTWVNLIITVGEGKAILYKNGAATTLASSGAIAAINNAAPLVIGGFYNYTNYGNGYLSELIIEKKTRTAQEVSDYYNSTKSIYGL